MNRTASIGRGALIVSLSLFPFAGPVRAQWAVIDVGAINQLVRQVADMEQALATANAQLLQAEKQLQSMTGGRGMQDLLPGVTRNYLPSTWGALAAAAQGVATPYPALAASVNALIGANAVLPGRQLALLSAADQRQITATRERVALDQAASQAAFADASGRFAGLQSLVTAIGAAPDQKAILELQARIEAELGMLQNEQNKLQLLAQTLQAEAAAQAQQARESVIAGHGSFATRFVPNP